jgi:hypothetical protein
VLCEAHSNSEALHAGTIELVSLFQFKAPVEWVALEFDSTSGQTTASNVMKHWTDFPTEVLVLTLAGHR